MALITGTKADKVTGLHAGGNARLAVAGLADPNGNDVILINPASVAEGGIVNALTVTTGATGTGVTLSVGGTNADTNRSITIVGAGTGATIIGSSVSPVTLAGAPTVSSNLAITGTMTVTGVLTTSTINSSGQITGTSAIYLNQGASSSAFTVMQFGLGSSSNNARMAIYVGSSYPTPPIGPAPGSLFFNQGGTSSTCLLIALPNAGTASSSNWASLSFAMLPS